METDIIFKRLQREFTEILQEKEIQDIINIVRLFRLQCLAGKKPFLKEIRRDTVLLQKYILKPENCIEEGSQESFEIIISFQPSANTIFNDFGDLWDNYELSRTRDMVEGAINICILDKVNKAKYLLSINLTTYDFSCVYKKGTGLFLPIDIETFWCKFEEILTNFERLIALS